MSERNIKITDITQISKKELTKFIEAHPNGNIFQTHLMWSVFNEIPKSHPIDVIATNSSGELEGVLIGYLTRYPLSTSRVVVYGGPIVKDPQIIPDMLRIFEKKVKAISRFPLLIDIRNMWDTSKDREQFFKVGYYYEDHLNYIIPLNRDIQELWYSIPKSRRKNIKRGLSRFMIKEINHIKDLKLAYQLILNTYKKAGVPGPSWDFLKTAFLHLGKTEYLKTFVAYSKETEMPMATRLILLFKDRVYDWYAGSLYTPEAKYSNETLVWKVLEYGATNGFKVFDFGGAGNPQKEYGPREFKKRFNGIEVNWGIYRRTFNPWAFKLITALASIRYPGITKQV